MKLYNKILLSQIFINTASAAGEAEGEIGMGEISGQQGAGRGSGTRLCSGCISFPLILLVLL